MNRQPSPRPEELLAAYADDALDPVERARVERYLADHPDAHRELAELRAVLVQMREAAPGSAADPANAAGEPDWASMAASIHAQCNDIEAARKPSPGQPMHARIGQHIRTWLEPLVESRTRLALVGCAAVAVLIAVLWRGHEPPQTARPEPTRADTNPATAPGVNTPDTLLAPDSPLRDEDEDDDEDFFDALAADMASQDSGAEEPVEYATGFGLELFAEPDYEIWLDDLSQEDLDALDMLLQTESSG